MSTLTERNTDMSTTTPTPVDSSSLETADAFSNPLARTRPLGGRTGVAIASVVPLSALVLFLVFGLAGGWAWSWAFFLLIPISGIAVYGFGSPRRRR
jgi:hypothetical protein